MAEIDPVTGKPYPPNATFQVTDVVVSLPAPGGGKLTVSQTDEITTDAQANVKTTRTLAYSASNTSTRAATLNLSHNGSITQAVLAAGASVSRQVNYKATDSWGLAGVDWS